MLPLSWIHLSDIHFYGTVKPAGLRFDQQTVARELRRDIVGMAERLGSPDLILVTGDIAFCADAKKEYPDAKDWFEHLLRALNLDGRRLLIVPGNHDVDRAVVKARKYRQRQRDLLRGKNPQTLPHALDEELDEEETRSDLWAKLCSFADFARHYGDTKLSAEHPFSLWDSQVTGSGVAAVGLNTALLSYDNEDSRDNLALGSRQLDAIHATSEDELLLVLMHHPPAELVDGEKLLSILSSRAALLFSGHVHRQRALLSLALGTSGHLHFQAGAGWNEETGEHGYSWGKIDAKGLSYCPRRFHKDTARFIDDAIPSDFTRQLSKKLGSCYYYPLRTLAKQLREWIKRQEATAAKRIKKEEPIILQAQVQAMEEHLFGDQREQAFQDRYEQARALSQQERPADAQSILDQLSRETQQLLPIASDEGQRLILRQRLIRCQLMKAQILLNQQEAATSLELCRSIANEYRQDARVLRIRGRVALAELLAALDETEEARQILPTDEEVGSVEPEERKGVAYVAQLIQIKQGDIPTAFEEDRLRLDAAYKLLQQGDAARAVRLVKSVSMDGNSRFDKHIRFNALLLLLNALGWTIWEAPSIKHGVPITERRWIVQFLEKYITAAVLSRPDKELLGLVCGYYQLTEQWERMQALLKGAEEEKAGIPEMTPEATRARWPQALADLMRSSTKPTPSLCLALEQLAEQYPQRAPIEYALADCLFILNEPERALPHARKAFLALPGLGQRRLLAQCFLNSRRFCRALSLLTPLSDEDPVVLEVRARAMAHEPRYMKASVPLLRRHLQRKPEDGGAWLALAQVQARLGQPDEAADAAWQARLHLPREILSPAALLECAQLQPITLGHMSRSRERIEEIVRLLQDEFPNDADAAHARFVLLSKLGFPNQYPINIKQLAQMGVLWAVPEEQAIALFRQGAEQVRYLRHMYHHGQLSFESLCKLIDTPPTLYLAQVFSQPQDAPEFICAPLSFGVGLLRERGRERLRGAHLLCSELELVLLLSLGIVGQLRDAIGRQGKIVLFADTIERIQHSGVEIQRQARYQPSVPLIPDATRETLATQSACGLALELQRIVAQWQTEEFVSVIIRPDVLSELPPVRNDKNAELNEAWIREPLATSLSYHRALSNGPERILLTADRLTAAPFSDPYTVARTLQWEDEQHFFKWRSQIRHDQVLDLPTLLHVLCPNDFDRQEQLVTLGFQDALDRRLLFELYRRHQGLDRKQPAAILESAERRARQNSSDGRWLARSHIAWIYGTAIWSAFCANPGPGWPAEAECPLFASALLGRCEALDGEIAPSILEEALGHIASLSAEMVRPSLRVTEDTAQVTDDSPTGRMWRFLSSWAGPDGHRRAVLGHALTRACLKLDQAAPGPDEVHAHTYLMAALCGQPSLDHIKLDSPEIEALAILSAGWEARPLSEISLEQTLQRAAQHLAQFSDKPLAVPWDERTYSFPDPGFPSPLALPAEAVLLRAPDEVIAWAAPVLAAHQGPQDARAYDLLTKIAANPGNKKLRRGYARLTVSAPWRRIRQLPSQLISWSPWNLTDRFPRSHEDLRRILGEHVLDETEGSISNIVRERPWVQLPHGRNLLLRACEIPGALPILSIAVRLDPRAYLDEVQEALYRLAHAQEQSSGRLCADIMFLRYAAQHQPIVRHPEGAIDLREVLPVRLAEALATTLAPRPQRPDEQATLADAEAPLLRLCARTITELAWPSPLPLREGLWLCYRTFQWLNDQLDSLPAVDRAQAFKVLRDLAPPPGSREDLLHPMHFGPDRIDQRLLGLLYGLSLGEHLAGLKTSDDAIRPLLLEPPVSPSALAQVTSPALEALLAQVAARPLTEAERAIRRLGQSPSCLDWYGPGAIPDLALGALLRLSHGRGWLQLPAAVRLAWIAQLPLGPEDKTSAHAGLALAIIDAAGDHCRALTVEEQTALLARLRSMSESHDVSLWRLVFYSALFATGRAELGVEVDALLRINLGHKASPTFFGRYLTGLSVAEPQQIEPKSMEILRLASSEQAPALLWGLGHVLLHGQEPGKASAASVLRTLSQLAPWRDDPRTSQLLHLLGITDKLNQ